MQLTTMFFDVGGTLETFRYTRELRLANTKCFRECLLTGGIDLPISDEELYETISGGISAYRKWSMPTMIELPTPEIWAKFVFGRYAIDAAALLPIAEQLSFLYETMYYQRELRPEVPAVLKEIQRLGVKIGCISNTQSTTQVPNTLKNYGVFEYFDPIVLSSTYGRRKPDPAIFYHAARLANAPTGACGYIGDKINRDVLGARKAGFQLALKVTHLYDDGEPDEGATPDAVLEDLSELPSLLEQVITSPQHQPLSCAKTVKAVFFDAGDILYYRPERDKHLNQFLGKHKTCPAANFEEERKRIKDLAFSGQIKRHDYYRQLICLYGIKDERDIEEGMQALSKDDNTVAIFDGVPETINSLKDRGFILGIITDTAMPFTRKLNWFDNHGFGRVWDVVISSKEIGVRKPAPTMYEEALRQTGIKPEEAVFVGHKASELEGAHAVGFKTIAYNYEEQAAADVYINNFCDLLKLPILEN